MPSRARPPARRSRGPEARSPQIRFRVSAEALLSLYRALAIAFPCILRHFCTFSTDPSFPSSLSSSLSACVVPLPISFCLQRKPGLKKLCRCNSFMTRLWLDFGEILASILRHRISKKLFDTSICHTSQTTKLVTETWPAFRGKSANVWQTGRATGEARIEDRP